MRKISYEENAAHTAGLGIGYLMGVKENQPTLLREAERLCGWGAHKQSGFACEAASPRELHQGKWLRRELYQSRDIEGSSGWESARQLWRVKQTTQYPDGKETIENRYFITNLAWGRLKGTEILAMVRAHWGVENGCHWTIDVVLRPTVIARKTSWRAIRNKTLSSCSFLNSTWRR